MRLPRRAGYLVVSVALVGACAASCGSDDDKKKQPGDGPSGGGEGGEVSGDGGKSGSAGATSRAGEPGVSGAAGVTGDEPTAGAGGIGGASSGPPFHGLYIAEDGDDAADGTESAPFATLERAASAAQPGDTIVFLDGSFAMGNQPVTIADGVSVAAQNAGQAQLTGGTAAAIFELAGDTTLTGLTVTSAQRVARFAGGAAAHGTLTVEQSSFVNCTVTCLELSGSASAVVSGTAGEVLGNGGGAFALVSDSASVSVTGGVLQNYQAGGMFRATGEAKVTLTDVAVKDGTGRVLSLTNDAIGVVSGAEIATLAQSVFEQADGSELSVKDSDVSLATASPYQCFVVVSTSKLSIEGSQLHGCGTGIKGAVPAQLSLIDSDFYDMSFGGMDLDTGGANPGGTVLIDGCSFHDSDYVAFRIGGPATLLDLKARSTEVDITSLANWHAIMLDGSSASTIDLGTLEEPGGNTFLQRAAALSSAMRLQFQAVTISAVGNTWTPNAQGADASGHYVVTSGKVLEDKTAVTTGINYNKPYDTATIRLAQIP